jgi:GTP cyclohydrolase IA
LRILPASGVSARQRMAGGLGSRLLPRQRRCLKNTKASPVNDHSDLPGTSKDLPVSERIRKRLQRNKLQFLANDNISSVIKPGEMDALLEEVAAKMKGVLESLVIDVEHDHNTQDTARRVAKMYLNEVFRGRYAAAPSVTEFPNAASLNELMIVGPITVRSACSHHFCPIMGRVWCPTSIPT